MFYKTVKDIQARLGDPKVVLNSFILSVTPYNDTGWWTDVLNKYELEARNVLFQVDDKPRYIEKMLAKMV
jgi:hypothetical protein